VAARGGQAPNTDGSIIQIQALIYGLLHKGVGR